MNSTSKTRVVRRGIGGLVAFIGFLLSPLSWWNDLVVNVPLALVFAWSVSLAYPAAFTGSFVLGYWLTNIAGLVLMHWGAAAAVSAGPVVYTRRRIVRDGAIALGYTVLIVLLVRLKILGPLPQLLGRMP